MNTRDLIDSQGKTILLGTLLGKGGEGSVYDLPQTPSVVAKVYHKPLSKERSDKISAMTTIRTDALSKLTAWPIDLIRVKTTGQPLGLLMPKIINRKNIHHLYGPKSRLLDFPKADWRFLVRAGANIARAFAVVHESGCVVGDVNHGSIMVGEDATVCLIDCDSFQVNALGRSFLCEVGIETFTPPELQGKPFRGVVRTPNFDNFGLAVVIFHLLFMGRHPFAGRFSGLGDMPIARAIKECRFPYSANHKSMQMDPPPGTPPLHFVGSDVANLFEAAFSQGAISAGRPSARVWASALQKLEQNTRRCGINPGHWHPATLPDCPWCRMEMQGAKPLFPLVLPVATGSSGPTLDTDALWKQLTELPLLGPLPPIPAAQVGISEAARKLGKRKNAARAAAISIGTVAFAVGTVVVPQLFFIWAIFSFILYDMLFRFGWKSTEIQRLKDTLDKSQETFTQAESAWVSRASENSFEEAKQKFASLRNELSQIPSKRNQALEQLRQSQRKVQLEKFLDRFELEDARIEGIGPGRKRTLESYGIETAQDIERHKIGSVPGFGPVMIDRLMRWRHSIESKFVYDPHKMIDPNDIARIERDILLRRTELENALRLAHKQAMEIYTRINDFRKTERVQLDALQRVLAQAKVDYEFLNR